MMTGQEIIDNANVVRGALRAGNFDPALNSFENLMTELTTLHASASQKKLEDAERDDTREG